MPCRPLWALLQAPRATPDLRCPDNKPHISFCLPSPASPCVQPIPSTCPPRPRSSPPALARAPPSLAAPAAPSRQQRVVPQQQRTTAAARCRRWHGRSRSPGSPGARVGLEHTMGLTCCWWLWHTRFPAVLPHPSHWSPAHATRVLHCCCAHASCSCRLDVGGATAAAGQRCAAVRLPRGCWHLATEPGPDDLQRCWAQVGVRCLQASERERMASPISHGLDLVCD